MTVRILVLAWAIGLASLAGCDKPLGAAGSGNPTSDSTPSARPSGGVGVVDLDVVAKQLGRDAEMSATLKERVTALNDRLTAMKENLTRLYDAKREKFGDQPDEEQQKQLVAMQERMDAQLIETKRKADGELGVLRQQLVDQFREQTKPILKEVAASRGLSIVIPKNNALLLTIDPGVEITDEVVQKMLTLKAPEAAETPERPKQAKRSTTTETSAR